MTRSEFLAGLAKLQQQTAPINLSIGWTDPETNQVKSNYIMITEAPPKVISYVATNLPGYAYSIHDGGLLISFDA